MLLSFSHNVHLCHYVVISPTYLLYFFVFQWDSFKHCKRDLMHRCCNAGGHFAFDSHLAFGCILNLLLVSDKVVSIVLNIAYD